MQTSSQRLLCRGLTFFLALVLLIQSLPAHAGIFTTTLTPAQYPATYGTADPTGGLYAACVNANNPQASATGRTVVIVVTPKMAAAVAGSLPSGQYYLGGYYNATRNAWYWAGENGAHPEMEFASGPSATPVATTLASNWSTGYPVLDATNAVGTRKYVVYDSTTNGWINVDGTTALSGVACQSLDMIDVSKKKFPWWAILIIVLGSVVVIAVVVTIVVCCCCCKKKKRSFDDDDDESSFSSRSGSFVSRGTSYTGSSYTGTTRSSSFSSRGSSYSGSSKASSATGSTTSGDSSSASSSSFSSQLTSYTSGSTSYGSGSSSAASSSRGSSSSGASSLTSSSRASSSISSSSRGSSVSSHSR